MASDSAIFEIARNMLEAFSNKLVPIDTKDLHSQVDRGTDWEEK